MVDSAAVLCIGSDFDLIEFFRAFISWKDAAKIGVRESGRDAREVGKDMDGASGPS